MQLGIRPFVVVMGVSGCGKSTVGAVLARQLGVPFGDADDFHTEQAKAKMAAGQPLDDADREPWLLRLAQWLREHAGGCVLACSALKRQYRDVLRTGAEQLCFVHLAGPAAVVADRIGHRANHYMPASLIASQYQALEPLQPDERGVTEDFTLGPDEIIKRVLDRSG